MNVNSTPFWLGSMLVLTSLAACHAPRLPDSLPAPTQPAPHSSTLAVSRDGTTLYVVNADADSISILDLTQRRLRQEVLLADAPPAADANGSFAPQVAPRALALAPDGGTLFVTGSHSNRLYAVDTRSFAVASVAVDSGPVGVLAQDGQVWVACAQDASVLRLEAAPLRVAQRAVVDAKPWALAWSAQGQLLVTHLLGPGVSVLDADSLHLQRRMALPGVAPRGDRRLAHGQARGLYDLQARPGSDELWVAHTLLGTDTPQPQLDFASTAFPAVAVVAGDAVAATLSTDASALPGVDGAFADVVSGVHAIAFTRDGNTALLLDTFSEDVLVVDAQRRVERALVRPLPGHMPEGLALSPNETEVYIDQRNTRDVAVFRLEGGRLTLQASIPRQAQDPMPAAVRQGQALFYSANSDQQPITTDHWIACATCHMEGRSDAVTWLFDQGPRDTPSNAGGVLDTGFLFRTADRSVVQDYWRTINTEQGGRVSPTAHAALLDALAAYVNLGIPLPSPPSLDTSAVARGAALFARADVGCASCHAGPAFTDSGAGNPNLDLGGPVLLHDVGTCVDGGVRPDTDHADAAGNPRSRCQFDTPGLRGLADTAPYLHDGSAATLRDLLARPGAHAAGAAGLSQTETQDLITYLQSL